MIFSMRVGAHREEILAHRVVRHVSGGIARSGCAA